MMSDKVERNLQVIAQCVSSNYSQKYQNTKHCITNGSKLSKIVYRIQKTEKKWLWLPLIQVFGQKAPNTRKYMALSSQR
jgi:hypothetical protein